MESNNLEQSNAEIGDVKNVDTENADVENVDTENADVENVDTENAEVENADAENADAENAEVENSNDCSEQSTVRVYWNKFKTESIRFLDRRQHSKNENIRLVVAAGIIVFIIGIFLPMLGATVKFSMIDSSKSKANSETVIFEPQNDIVQFSSGDLIFHQPLREFELLGTEIGDMQIMGINLYDTLTTPMPDYSGVTKAKDGLGALSILTDKKFVHFCNKNLGDLGKTVVEVGEVVNEIAEPLSNALGKVEKALDEVKEASDNTREAIQNAENTLNTIDTIIAIVFVIMIIMMLLVLFRKNKKYIIPGILTFFSAIFVIIGIAVIVINTIIRNAITSGMNNLSESITDMLDDLMPGLSDMLVQLTSADKLTFLFDASFYCGAGWWLSTIGIVGVTVLSYILVKMEKKTAVTELPDPETRN